MPPGAVIERVGLMVNGLQSPLARPSADDLWIPVENARPFVRLFTRFGNYGGAARPLALSTQVVPVTQIDDVTSQWDLSSSASASFTTTGFKTVLTVGTGKRMRIWAIQIGRTGDATFNYMGIENISASDTMLLTANSAGQTSLLYDPNKLLVLDERMKLFVSCDGVGSGGTFTMILYSYIEDAF
jgi:hypothetical protein